MGRSGRKDMVSMSVAVTLTGSPNLSTTSSLLAEYEAFSNIHSLPYAPGKVGGYRDALPRLSFQEELIVPTSGLLLAHNSQQSGPFRIALSTESHLTKVTPYRFTLQ
jgi:hypothetical protein